MRVPLHIKSHNRSKADYARLAELYATMASLNPKGFRQFSTKKKKQNKREPLSETYARMAGMYGELTP